MMKTKEGISVRSVFIFLIACLCIGLYDYWLFGFGRDFISLFILQLYLLIITPEDCKHHTISNLATMIFAVMFLIVRITSMDLYELLDAAAGSTVSLVLLGIPYMIRREWIGTGDVKAMACCGIILGLFGVLHFMFRVFLFVAAYCVIQLVRKKIEMKSEVPMAPFMLLAALI